MKEGCAGKEIPICQRPECKRMKEGSTKADTHQIELADLLPLQLSKAAVFINSTSSTAGPKLEKESTGDEKKHYH